jgi:hypothetical protein
MEYDAYRDFDEHEEFDRRGFWEDLEDTGLCAWVPPRDWRVGKWGTLGIASYASAFPTAPEPAGLRIYSLTRTATGWATQDGTASVDLGPVPDPSRPPLVHLPGAARPDYTYVAREALCEAYESGGYPTAYLREDGAMLLPWVLQPGGLFPPLLRRFKPGTKSQQQIWASTSCA